MRYSTFCGFAAALLSLAAIGSSAAADRWGMETGKVELKSAGPLAFGPQGILFVGDPSAATVYAIATNDPPGDAAKVSLNISDFSAKLAEALGATGKQVQVSRIATNPVSGNVYVSATITEPKQAVLVRVDASGKINKLPLENVKFSKAPLPSAPNETPAAGRRGNPRDQSITDLAWTSSKLIVSGLAGDNPLSAVQEIAFPFGSDSSWTDVEIYHTAHARVEDGAPVRALVPFNVDGKPVLLAGFTCTPLVMFPLESLEPGKKVRGKTIAELGSGNQPLEMFVYNKDGKDFLLMSNSARGVMKISTDKIQDAASLETPVRGGGTAGQPFETVKSLRGVQQMDRLNEGHLVFLAKAEDGSLSLQTAELP